VCHECYYNVLDVLSSCYTVISAVDQLGEWGEVREEEVKKTSLVCTISQNYFSAQLVNLLNS